MRQFRTQASYVVAVVAPLAIALVFPHPARRVVVPACLMLIVVFFTTVIGRRSAGLVAAAVSALSLWFFNLPPAYSFSTEETDDLVSVALVFVIGCGCAWFMTDALRRFTRERELADEVRVQAHTIQQLQLALLPRLVPDAAGLTVRSRYVPAQSEGALAIGGDWYALIPLDDGRVGIGLGDVAGHGLPAVAAMAETRFALRTVALDTTEPGEVLDKLDRAITVFRGAEAVTAVYAVVDGVRGTFTFANAGHPPPMVRRADGRVVTLNGDRHGPLLGPIATEPYSSYTEQLGRDDVLVLYTDGLVERRGEHLDTGFARLARTLTECHPDDLDEMVTVLLGTVPPGADDDVAVVVVRFDGVAPLTPDHAEGAARRPAPDRTQPRTVPAPMPSGTPSG